MKLLRYSSFYFILLILQIIKLPAQEANEELLLVECEIVKIDSVGNYYVIYVKDSSEKYKIVSEKDSSVCQNIVVGQFYKVTLDPLLEPMNSSSVTLHGGATIISYGWGNGLYFALDIRGLCYNSEFKVDILKRRKEFEEQKPLKFKNERAKKKYYKSLFDKLSEKIGNERYYEKDPLFEWEYDSK